MNVLRAHDYVQPAEIWQPDFRALRRILAALIAAILVVLTGCGNSPANVPPDGGGSGAELKPSPGVVMRLVKAVTNGLLPPSPSSAT